MHLGRSRRHIDRLSNSIPLLLLLFAILTSSLTSILAIIFINHDQIAAFTS